MVCSERSWPLRWTISTAVMIMPGVQKPHCRPWCSRNASCIGCSGAPSGARPSMVLTSCPSAMTASVVQDLTALPSRCTTQAPHCEVSQPTCTGQPQILAQKLHQQCAGVDVGIDGIAVHDQGNLGHSALSSSALLHCTATQSLKSLQSHNMGHPGNEQPHLGHGPIRLSGTWPRTWPGT